MRLGVSLAQDGRLAEPACVRSAAVAAEQVGYSSIWVHDRLLGRDEPGGPALDPLSVLTYAAAVTSRVRLGTSVLVAPWYRPALLVRSLTSLDVLSEGRLTVGLGLGGSLDEFAALGVPQRELGRRLDDALDVLRTAWGADPSSLGPAPVQQPGPPVLLAASTPAELDRVARRADGWNPTGLPVELLAPMWTDLRDRAAGHGRDPDALALVVRADLVVTDRPVAGDRPSYTGTVDQVAADLDATRRAGADEVILGLAGDHCLNETLELYARVAEAAIEMSEVAAPA
jgi:probable F420-dependent oxidoreductase